MPAQVSRRGAGEGGCSGGSPPPLRPSHPPGHRSGGPTLHRSGGRPGSADVPPPPPSPLAHPCSACGRRAAARPAAAPGRARRRGRGWLGSGRAAGGRSGGSRGPPPPCPAGRLSPSAPPWLWRSRNCRRGAGRDGGGLGCGAGAALCAAAL